MDHSHNIRTSINLKRSTQGKNTFSLDVNLTLAGQGITAIFGHSGSGKTTLLRCIAGLERPELGIIRINSDVWQDQSSFIPTHKRSLGYVFQEASLFPHLSTRENLYYAIKRAWEPVDQAFIEKVITVMGIESLLERYPHALSGGERQRVAIARALLIKPRVLLMDEPLAALDSARKAEIIPYLAQLPSVFSIPILYVSHSLEEVTQLADFCVLLDQGQVMAQGTPQEVFSRIDLARNFAEDTGVILNGKVIERDSQWHLSQIEFSNSRLWVRDGGDCIGDSVRLRILARDISLAEEPSEQSSILNRIPVQVTEIAPDDDEAMSLVRLQTGTDFLIARLTNRSIDHLKIQAGHELWAQIKSVALVR